MLEIMIPTYKWNDEDWILRNTDNNLIENLKYCDGTVKNIIFEVTKFNKRDINRLYKQYKWLNKVMIIKDMKIIGIYERKIM